MDPVSPDFLRPNSKAKKKNLQKVALLFLFTTFVAVTGLVRFLTQNKSNFIDKTLLTMMFFEFYL